LQRSARFCTLLSNFCNFLRSFAPLFRRFFLALFTQTTHAANQHLFIDQKQTSPREETKKIAISPHFLNFKKFHLSIMLICATLRTAISTGTKNRVFGPHQYKPNSNPTQTQFKPNTNPIQTQTNPICSEIVEPVSKGSFTHG
jgi:hypothetical protein